MNKRKRTVTAHANDIKFIGNDVILKCWSPGDEPYEIKVVLKSVDAWMLACFARKARQRLNSEVNSAIYVRDNFVAAAQTNETKP